MPSDLQYLKSTFASSSLPRKEKPVKKPKTVKRKETINLYQYTSANNIAGTKLFLQCEGLPAPKSAQEAALMLADVVRKQGNIGLEKIKSIHPDKELLESNFNFLNVTGYIVKNDMNLGEQLINGVRTPVKITKGQTVEGGDIIKKFLFGKNTQGIEYLNDFFIPLENLEPTGSKTAEPGFLRQENLIIMGSCLFGLVLLTIILKKAIKK